MSADAAYELGPARVGRVLLLAALLGSSALSVPLPALAEVATDGTLGRRVRLTGRDVEVGADLGRVSGRNLFHSFQRFGVASGGSVTFTGPRGLDNVISRVTGGEVSRIDGTLRSRVPGADVYLVNPAGVVFGPGARLDVPGSFHASTADEVRFPDGAAFSALDPGGSTLSVAAPEAFGFLGGRPGAIAVERGALEVPAGEALSLVGGDVTIEAGRVKAEAGTVTLAALGGPGAAGVGTGEIAGGAEGGSVRLAGSALVEATGDGGGTVRIRGGRLVVEGGSFVFNDNAGPSAPSGRISIKGREVEVGGRSFITADVLSGATGDTGPIEIEADRLVLGGGSQIRTKTDGEGDAGAVVVAAGTLEINTDGRLASETNGSGGGNDVRVTSGRLLISGEGQETFTGISAVASGDGRAGDVLVDATDIELRAGGEITSSTLGSAQGGDLSIRADRLRVLGGTTDRFFGVSSDTFGAGAGGTVSIVAGDAEIRHGGVVSSSTFGPGRAGEVEVTADRLLISGDGTARFTGIQGAAFENAEQPSESYGDAGAVAVTAREIDLRDRGGISAASFAPGADAGRLTVRADRLRIIGVDVGNESFGISANTFRTGNAGAVVVGAGSLEIRRGGSVSSSTFGPGRAGEVTIVADRMLVSGDGAEPFTGVSGTTFGAGPGGTVVVRAGDLEVRDAGQIRGATFGPGEAGAVQVNAGRSIELDDGGRIATDSGTGNTGDAGEVLVDAPRLSVRDGGEIGSSGFGAGRAGNIRLQAGTLLIEHARVRTEGGGAEGGEIKADVKHLIVLTGAEVTSNGIVPALGASLITLEAPQIALLGGSRVTSLTGDGDPLTGSGEARVLGDVTFISDDSEVRGSSAVELVGLDNTVGSGLQISPGAFVDAEGLLSESCNARAAGRASTFTRAGRKGGLPPAPDRPLASAGAPRNGERAVSAALVPGPLLLAACDGVAF